MGPLIGWLRNYSFPNSDSFPNSELDSVPLGFFVYCRPPRPLIMPARKSKKERSMENNRVLGRAGARTLSDEEIQQVAAGFKIARSFFGSGLGTGACNYDPVTCR